MNILESIIILLAFLILANGAQFLEPNCGISISGSQRSGMGTAGGQVADMFGNPWMAYVHSSTTVCSGSLITHRFVLTAAHCLTYEYTVVRLGDFDLSSPTDCSDEGCMPNALQVTVDQQIAHPQYVQFTRDDIALLRLARSVQYTDYIRPICLLTNLNPLSTLRYLTITSWGKTESGRPSNILKVYTLQQHDRTYCALRFNLRVDQSHICASCRYSSVNCKGDSGSPVSTTFNTDGARRIVQLGIMSTKPQNSNSVEIYTNVMHHIDWIREVVRQDGTETPQYPTRYPPTNYLSICY